MNRFLTRKKAKRQQPEPVRPEINLAMTLPSNDDFRTSLLMNGLSARFSMLREQDDPHSLLGKASDDSVLQPRRQSRLYDFGFQPSGLSDIAEVSSINGSIRPPFANERSNSYSSDIGYGTDGETETGSVMSRARPGEGNVLFGGRQKITRIAGDGKGRTLYDDDVAMSTFQRFRAEERQREREAALREHTKVSSEDDRKSPSKPGSYATSVAGSLRRQTSSSTATSGMDSRSSTAATSINSQGPASIPPSASATISNFNFGPSVTNASRDGPPSPSPAQQQQQSSAASSSPAASASGSAPQLDRTLTKRRLYEQSLDRDIQDQQSSTLSRLQSIQKRPGMANGSNAPEFWQGRNGFAPRSGAPPVRSSSPSPSPIDRVPVANGLPGKDIRRGRSNATRSPESISPPQSSNGERTGVLASSIDPNDRGKATALGVFNKPKRFDEQQFLERSLTLRKGRDTPTRADLLDSPKESEEIDRAEASIFSQPASSSTPAAAAPTKPTLAPAPWDKARSISNPTPPSPVRSTQSQAPWEKSRAKSTGQVDRSRSGSGDEPVQPAPAPVQAPSGFSVFQRAANQMKGVAEPEEDKTQSPKTMQRNKFMFVDDSDSDYDEEKTVPTPQPTKTARLPPNTRIPNDAPLIAPPQHEHPAFRNSPQPSRENLRAEVRKPSFEARKPSLDAPASQPRKGSSNEQSSDLDVESPTLPGGAGLSTMIQHLRNTSATSTYSVAAPAAPVPSFPPSLQTRNINHVAGQTSAGAENTAHSSYSHSNPWDLEDYKGAYGDVSAGDSANGPEEPKEERPAEVATPSAPKPEAQEQSWQHELQKKTHSRGGSTETQQEREDFAKELAMRQKAIQEKLRERAESPLRSSSPTSNRSGPFKGMLRQKSSMDNFRNRGTDKGMRVLGSSVSSTSLANGTSTASNERPSYETERRDPPRSVPLPVSGPSRDFQQTNYGSNSNQSSRPGTSRESDERIRSRSRSNSTAPLPTTGRSRSNSEHSGGRSRSRNGRYRDDVADGNGTMTPATIPEDLPPQPPAPEHPIPDLPGSPSTSPNGLKEYRPVDPAIFEQKGLWPPPQNPIVHPLGIPSPRPSPGFAPVGALSPSFTGPTPRPSPAMGSMSPALPNSGRGTPIGTFANPTPPLSASNTPTAPSFSASTPSLNSASNLKAARQRKMSIKKSDIGDPVLISTTSVVDTVDLPSGASLRNGMDAPPVPPINPRRKRFPFTRADTDPPEAPYPSSSYGSRSSDEREQIQNPRLGHRLKKSSSDGAKIGLYLRAQREATQSTPALQNLSNSGSPPRMQNGMF